MFSIIIFSRILFYRLVENAVSKHANRSEKTLHQVNCILCLPTNKKENYNKKIQFYFIDTHTLGVGLTPAITDI